MASGWPQVGQRDRGGGGSPCYVGAGGPPGRAARTLLSSWGLLGARTLTWSGGGGGGGFSAYHSSPGAQTPRQEQGGQLAGLEGPPRGLDNRPLAGQE